MPLAAYLPETPTRDESHPVADAMAKDPSLRALRAPQLARAIGVPTVDAINALAMVTRRTTGAIDRSNRSLDERFAMHGRAVAAASWDDAGSLWRAPQRPRRRVADAGAVLWPGAMKTPLPLGFVYEIGQRQTWPADPSNPNEPHPAILENLVLFSGSMVKGAMGLLPATWRELSESTQSNLRALWRNQLAGRSLPTDSEETNEAIQWPDAGDTLERKIYFWDIEGDRTEIYNGRGRVLQRMQLQKWSNKDQVWRVYNQWGQDLLFTRKGTADRWEAGWDLGTWLKQNEVAIADAIRHGMQAVALGVATIFSAGAAAPIVGAGIAAWEAEIRAFQFLAKGDIANATANMILAAQGFGTILGKSKEGQEWGAAFSKWAQQNAPILEKLATEPKNYLNVFAKTLDAAKSKLQGLDLPILRDAARLIANQIPKIDPATDLKKAFDQAGPVAAFFERGYREVSAGNIPDDIPWYARAAYAQGQTYRATADQQRLGAGSFGFTTAIKPAAPRIDPAKLIEAQKYEATAAELCNSAEVMRRANRPKEAALLQAQCDAAKAKAAALMKAGIVATPTSSGGDVAPLAVGAGLLYLLLKGFAL